MAISPQGCTLAKLLNTSGRDMDLFNYIVAITEVLCCFPRHHLLVGDWPFFTIEVVGTRMEKLEKIYNHMTPRGLQHESTFKEKKDKKRNAHWGAELFATSLRMFLSSTGLCGWSMTPRNLLRAFADVRASVVFAYVELLQKRMFKNRICFTRLKREVFNYEIQEDYRFQQKFWIVLVDLLITKCLFTNRFTLIHKTYLSFSLEIPDLSANVFILQPFYPNYQKFVHWPITGNSLPSQYLENNLLSEMVGSKWLTPKNGNI